MGCFSPRIDVASQRLQLFDKKMSRARRQTFRRKIISLGQPITAESLRHLIFWFKFRTPKRLQLIFKAITVNQSCTEQQLLRFISKLQNSTPGELASIFYKIYQCMNSWDSIQEFSHDLGPFLKSSFPQSHKIDLQYFTTLFLKKVRIGQLQSNIKMLDEEGIQQSMDPLVVKNRGFLIQLKWFRKWQYSSLKFNSKYPKITRSSTKIDESRMPKFRRLHSFSNFSLLDNFPKAIRASAQEGLDFVVVNEQAWRVFTQLYEGGPELIRFRVSGQWDFYTIIFLQFQVADGKLTNQIINESSMSCMEQPVLKDGHSMFAKVSNSWKKLQRLPLIRQDIYGVVAVITVRNQAINQLAFLDRKFISCENVQQGDSFQVQIPLSSKRKIWKSIFLRSVESQVISCYIDGKIHTITKNLFDKLKIINRPKLFPDIGNSSFIAQLITIFLKFKLGGSKLNKLRAEVDSGGLGLGYLYEQTKKIDRMQNRNNMSILQNYMSQLAGDDQQFQHCFQINSEVQYFCFKCKQTQQRFSSCLFLPLELPSQESYMRLFRLVNFNYHQQLIKITVNDTLVLLMEQLKERHNSGQVRVYVLQDHELKELISIERSLSQLGINQNHIIIYWIPQSTKSSSLNYDCPQFVDVLVQDQVRPARLINKENGIYHVFLKDNQQEIKSNFLQVFKYGTKRTQEVTMLLPIMHRYRGPEGDLKKFGFPSVVQVQVRETMSEINSKVGKGVKFNLQGMENPFSLQLLEFTFEFQYQQKQKTIIGVQSLKIRPFEIFLCFSSSLQCASCYLKDLKCKCIHSKTPLEWEIKKSEDYCLILVWKQPKLHNIFPFKMNRPSPKKISIQNSIDYAFLQRQVISLCTCGNQQLRTRKFVNRPPRFLMICLIRFQYKGWSPRDLYRWLSPDPAIYIYQKGKKVQYRLIARLNRKGDLRVSDDQAAFFWENKWYYYDGNESKCSESSPLLLLYKIR